MKDSDCLQNIDKQVKVQDLEKHIYRLVYKLYGLTEELQLWRGKDRIQCKKV